MVNPEMKKIFITGASSFVGCHIVKGISKASEWEVTPIGRKNPEDYKTQEFRRVEFGGKKNNWTVLNLKNKSSVNKLIQKFRPDIWVHHAGYTKNYLDPNYDSQEGYDTNIAPLKYIFESLAQNDCQGVIITGTDREYSETNKVCLESDSCFPDSPYGQSKLEETLTALELSVKFKIPTRIARLFIPFGFLDNPNKLIYYVLDRLQNRNLVNLSPCKQKRDFIYIDDVVEAYCLLIKDLSRGGAEIFNICSGQAIPVEDIVNCLAEKVGASKSLLNFGSQSMRIGEQMISYGNNDKAREILGWEPKEIQDGISKLINF